MGTQLKSIRWAVATWLCAFSILSVAQTADEKAAKEKDAVLQEIVVTGSLLKRATIDIAQPVVVLQAEDLIKEGAMNPEQILQRIVSNQPEFVSNATIGSGTAAGSYANLRSLGSPRTLVLLDGKRIVNNPYQTVGVDLNTVPLALVEKVEVLASGGSATYGTDAIAGVVNFITPKEMRGLNASATAETPEHSGGGQSVLANLSGGFGSLASDGWNVYGGFSYHQSNELRNIDRSFTATGYLPQRGVDLTQSRSNPANYTQDNLDLINPAAPACKGPALIAVSDRQCNYDVTQTNDIMIPQKQVSGLVKGAMKLGDNHTLSFEYVRGDSKLTPTVSPLGPSGITMHPNSPYFPGNGITPAPADPAFDPNSDIHFSWRVTELGQRIAEVDGYTDRAVAQLEGRLGAWEYQASAEISTSVVKVNLQNGFVNEPLMRAGFDGSVPGVFLNPFGPQDAAGLAYLRSVEVIGNAQTATGALKTYGVQFNRDLFELPGGRVALALAADYKQEDARLENNFSITDSLPNVFAGVQNVRGDRSSKGGSFEMRLPVLKGLEVDLSGRYDDYSDFGSTTNPQIGVIYQAAHWLSLRGSYSKAFRAPTLYNIFEPTTIDTVSGEHNDPILCPGGVPVPGGNFTRDCASGSSLTNAVLGGNPDLKPEKSNAYTLGFTLKPVERTSFGVDYFNYHLKNTIGQLGDVAIFDNLARYGSRIIRCKEVAAADRPLYNNCVDPVLITDASPVDPIAYVQDTLSNLGDTKTSGFDLTFDWTSVRTAVGTFGVRYNGTYITKYEYQREPGGEFVNRLGRTTDFAAVLRYVHSLTASWDRGPVTLELTHRYKSSYGDCNVDCLADPDPKFFNTVAAFQTLDLSGTYRWNDHFTILGTIGNLFNEAPPFTNGGNTQSVNFDDRYANALLRTYLLTATYKF